MYVRSADGYYTCLGRSSDMIKAGGIWVSPAEVEARLLEHPGVAQAAVVGLADADGLETPMACVVRTQNLPVQEQAPQGEAVQERAPQGEAVQERAAQGEAVQERAAQGEAVQERAAQGAVQEQAAQDEAVQEQAAQGAVQEQVPQDEAAQAADLVAFCRDGLAAFKRPRAILFVDSLPVTATGKLRRFAVREMAGELLAEQPGSELPGRERA